MEYNRTPPEHDFDHIKTKVNVGYDISRDLVGYMVRISDDNTKKEFTLKLKTKPNGEVVSVSVNRGVY